MKYAVLEWEEEGMDDIPAIICTNASKESAEELVSSAAPHLHREIIAMDQIQRVGGAV